MYTGTALLLFHLEATHGGETVIRRTGRQAIDCLHPNFNGPGARL